jgi:hypothetical protein
VHVLPPQTPPGFPGGVGNTHGNKADFDSLFHDVTTKLFDRLDDGVTFYPGHGKTPPSAPSGHPWTNGAPAAGGVRPLQHRTVYRLVD